MSEDNPYSAPSAEVVDAESAGMELREPRNVPAGHGWGWIAEGFGYFRESWGVWLAIVVVWMVITIALSVIPIVSLLVSVLSPIFMGGMMLGLRAQDDNTGPEFMHLFAGFQERLGPLAAVGGWYLLGGLLIGIISVVVVLGFGGMDVLQAAGNAQGNVQNIDPEALGSGMLISVLVVVMLSIPLLMAFWFAPALVALHDIGSLQAMVLSFRGCLRNIVPFLVYGVVMIVLGVIASIPLLLGWLVLSPVLIASIYVAYKDIFLAE
jgi:hypothetical protein